MKKLYQILRTAILCVVGVFAGTSIHQYIDYRQRPGLYALTSAQSKKCTAMRCDAHEKSRHGPAFPFISFPHKTAASSC